MVSFKDRESAISHFKQRSETSDRPQRFKVGKESFVYEGGKLIEYEYEVPLEQAQEM